jgi:Subtilase family/RTX calcium-binding nonapeptide repeat (4 copies)
MEARGARRTIIAFGLAAVLLLATAVIMAPAAFGVARDFENPASHATSQQFAIVNPQRADTPNDPNYDQAEPDDQDNGTATNLYDERFDLFGFPSQLTRATAVYGAGPHMGQPQVSGYNAAGAWKLDRGNPSVAIAILDTGIKWDKDDLRTQIKLNKGELPVPLHDRGSASSDPSSVPGGNCNNMANNADPYDANHDGAFNVLDYVCDSRVGPGDGANGDVSKLDAEDLIATFSDSGFSGGGKSGGVDDDANGFVDDIAGWDFFDNDNDPYDASSYFAASNHGSGRAENAAERGNDGQGEIGTCPHCQILPIRTWDTFVSDGNNFGMGILYATDNGASVIEGANGSLYHSAFAEAASNYAYQQGVVQTFSGDDLNTGNHNYPANYGHAMLIQGTVPDTIGLGQDAGQAAALFGGLCTLSLCIGSDIPPGTYFRGANTTQYGGKSSISMEGTTGSENTGKAAGAAGLVISAAKDASPAVDLAPDETREILEQTSERILDGNTTGVLGAPDPGADPMADPENQWTSHFGWGRVNLGAAVQAAHDAAIPPQAAIDSPDWYAPVKGSSLHVTGRATAPHASGPFTWKLEWGVGEAPTSWTMAGSGSSSGTVTNFGNIDLAQVRTAIANAPPLATDTGGPTFSPTSPNPYANEFTVRLTVSDPDVQIQGIDRRVFTSLDDPTLRNGFPTRMGTGGEAPLRYADLNGDNVQELIVPTEDGQIHAYEPDGSELAGWPVHTQEQISAAGHGSAPGFAALEQATPPREPPRGPVIADLDDDGRPEVIDTAGTHLYAWEPDGTLRPGFPISSNLAFCGPSLESQPLVHPKCGFLASPAVGRLEGQAKPLDIVATALDGHLYAFDGSGDPLPDFPVKLQDSAIAPADRMTAESINEPAIGDLNGDGKDDVVVATNETYDAATGAPTPGDGCGSGVSELLASTAGGSSRVYAVSGADGSFLPGWPIELNGAIQDELPLIGPGQDPALAKINGQQTVIASTTGSTTIGEFDTQGNLVRSAEQCTDGAGSDATDKSGSVNLFESTSVGALLPGGGPDIVKYGLSINDLANLLLVGQNLPYNHLIGAYDATTGQPLPSFPRVTDDFQFLSASDIANVNGGPTNQVVAGTGLGLIHAYDGTTGLDAAGFPKVTGGWLFAPAAFSNDGRMADITREGYLFQWNLPNLPACQTQWPSFRHDPQQSGNYDRDGTPPNAASGLAVKGDTLDFKTPGDDYGCGTATKLQVATADHPIESVNFATADRLGGVPDPAPAGTKQSFALPAHKRYVAIRAIDDAGNVGPAADIDTHTGGGGGGGHPACGNVIRGDTGDNHLRGTRFGDKINGRNGADKIRGLRGKDCLNGGAGRDNLDGGKGADRVKGGKGADRIHAGAKDRINAGPGRDRVRVKGHPKGVNCGPGDDVAIVRKHAKLKLHGCEKVRRR